ncbi:MAG: DNA topoisomerase IB [Solirubrobacterales bacterium]
MPRLKRSDCSRKGISRRRAGKGFFYLDAQGERVKDEELIDRIRALAIPPAWREVWICPFDNGHIQATGIDDAGRKQYLYHEKWSLQRSMAKFDEMLDFSRKLPALRKAVAADLTGEEFSKERVIACAVRLMDLGFFRIGSEQYAEENETYGVATILRSHVSLLEGDGVRFEYSAKGSQERIQDVEDPDVRQVAEAMLRRRSGPDDFLAYKEGRSWVDIRSGDINEYIQRYARETSSAKDFRTWNGTVLAAVELAVGVMPDSKRGRERRIREAVEVVSEHLGNTPAVCRASYIDPRLLDRFRNGHRIDVPRGWEVGSSPRTRAKIERRVRELIEG